MNCTITSDGVAEVPRKGDWMSTYGGGRFYPLDPRPEEVDINTIAHALALINRYGGHSLFAYSVAQHSVLLSYFVPPENALEALLHDAAEAYTGDVIRPIKHNANFAILRSLEASIWQRAIVPALSLPLLRSKVVHRADTALMLWEAQLLLPQGEPWWNGEKYVGIEPIQANIMEWSWRVAEEKFLNRYWKLVSQLEVTKEPKQAAKDWS